MNLVHEQSRLGRIKLAGPFGSANFIILMRDSNGAERRPIREDERASSGEREFGVDALSVNNKVFNEGRISLVTQRCNGSNPRE